MVIYNKDFGCCRVIPNTGEMASGKLRALLSHAIVGVRANFVPGPEIIGQPGSFRSIPGLRSSGPFLKSPKKSGLFLAPERGLITEIKKASSAEVIPTAFQANSLQFRIYGLFEKWDIMVQDLVLKRFRTSGNNYFFPTENCRDEVGPCFTRSSAGLDYERCLRTE